MDETVQADLSLDSALTLGGAFVEMDFATRTLYRTAVEQLARGSRFSELEIASLAVAEAHKPHPVVAPVEQLRHSDPGYYLLAGGRSKFQKSIGFRGRLFGRTPHDQVEFLCLQRRHRRYIGMPMGAPLIVLARMGLGVGLLCLLACLGVVSAIDVGVALVNRATAFFSTPSRCPDWSCATECQNRCAR